MRNYILGSLIVLTACGTPLSTEKTTVLDSVVVCVDSTMVVDTLMIDSTMASADTTTVDTAKN